VLRTLTRTVLGIVAPPTDAAARGGTGVAARYRYAIPVDDGSRVRPQAPEAPWGDPPELFRFAVVTTEAFPPEWWRRPRTEPQESPFLDHHARPAASTTDRADEQSRSGQARSRSARAQPHSAPTLTAAGVSPAPAIPLAAGRDAGASDRTLDEPRQRRRLFARICLVLAGALISFIVVDAASGHGRDT
jgi:hypothetical protein